MASFGTHSQTQLSTCHPKLQLVLNEAIKYFDFTIQEGFRNQADQHKAFLEGNSKLDWPNGNHNQNPSRAADCYPYPIDFSDNTKNLQRFCVLAGVIHTAAQLVGVKIRWGGDWNQNWDMRDEPNFRDLPHFELAKDE